nr:rhamnulokinase family protein [Candidatus Sigynarchaeum springense]MDO8117999.1 rhamnulokinase family protein [Candidatus Sigynarchaeota archaeon]
MASKYVAVDMGAESGRLVLGSITDGKLEVKELHRYKTQGTDVHGHMYWDVLRFYEEIIAGLKGNAKQFDNGTIDGIGIDTWGVDFVILDRHDNLVGLPYHYRDPAMNNALDDLLRVIPREQIYEKTGIQFMSLNTIVKLHALAKGGHPCTTPGVGKSFLMMPDYFNYLLSGEKAIEYTDASTTQLLDATTRDWIVPFLEKIHVDATMFSKPVQPGHVLGHVTPALLERIGVKSAAVHLTASHDTAAAVAGTPLGSRNAAYISSGTWSLLGVELDRPILTRKALEMNFTNEGGIGGTIRLLKNIAGMWLLQQSKARWEMETGSRLEYDRIMDEARKCESFDSIVFPDDNSRFLNPQNMLEAIRNACKDTGQRPPKKFGEFAALVFASLALRYRHVLGMLQDLTGIRIGALHIVGGGSRNSLMCQYAADATGVPVLAGPDEATSIGNIIVQSISNGEVRDIKAGRKLVDASFPPRRFEPADQERWNRLFNEKYAPLFIEKKD